MKDEKKPLKPWIKPELKTLSISKDTKQDGPKDPPDYEPQAS